MSSVHIQNPDKEGNKKRLKKALISIGWSGSPEQEQGILRLVISIAFLSYLLIISPEDNADPHAWATGLGIITGFLIYSLVLLTSTLAYPQYALTQRVISICIDIGVFSYGLHVTGPLSAPWFGVYLWVTLGNGFRYGEKYLYLSATVSLIGFTSVAKFTPYWATHTGLAIGIAFTFYGFRAFLILLPIIGFISGFYIGAQAMQIALNEGFLATVLSIIVGLASGVIGAFASYIFMILGIILVAGILGFAITAGILDLIGVSTGCLSSLVGLASAAVAVWLTWRYKLIRYLKKTIYSIQQFTHRRPMVDSLLPMNCEDAVRRWKFNPSTLNGKPVEVLYILTVRFNLQ